jgi:uncharacterized protein YuzE
VRLEYDPDVDAAYIQLVEMIGAGGVTTAVTATNSINLDFDHDGKQVGIEVLAARSLLRDETLRFAET